MEQITNSSFANSQTKVEEQNQTHFYNTHYFQEEYQKSFWNDASKIIFIYTSSNALPGKANTRSSI